VLGLFVDMDKLYHRILFVTTLTVLLLELNTPSLLGVILPMLTLLLSRFNSILGSNP